MMIQVPRNAIIPWAYDSPLKSRDELPRLLNERGLLGYAAEIGTHRGEYAAKFLSVWRGGLLYCIDPWQDDLSEYGDLVGRDRLQDYNAAVDTLWAFGGRAAIYVGTSEDFSNHVSDSSLDFAYIDANHAESFVRQDIALWWPKIKPGGMLAGHDILKCGKEVDAGIQRAVREHCVKHGVDCWIIRGEEGDPNFPWSWYVWKEG